MNVCSFHMCFTEPRSHAEFSRVLTLRAGGERECSEATICDELNVVEFEAVASVFVAQRPPQA